MPSGGLAMSQVIGAPDKRGVILKWPRAHEAVEHSTAQFCMSTHPHVESSILRSATCEWFDTHSVLHQFCVSSACQLTRMWQVQT